MSAQHSHDHVTPAPCCGAAPASSTAPVFAPGAGEQVSRIHIEQMDCRLVGTPALEALGFLNHEAATVQSSEPMGIHSDSR